MSLEKPFADLGLADLHDLIPASVREGKVIEYKEALPTGGDGDKKEFLADTSSFSNTAGGHLIYGIKETNGLPLEVVGVDAATVDTAMQRFENLIRDGIQPRLPGVQMKAIAVTESTATIVLRIPRSWALPHRVTLGGDMTSFTGGMRPENTLSMCRSCGHCLLCPSPLPSGCEASGPNE